MHAFEQYSLFQISITALVNLCNFIENVLDGESIHLISLDEFKFLVYNNDQILEG